MGGPNVILSFESKLATNHEEMDTTFLRIRSYSYIQLTQLFKRASKSFKKTKLMPKNHKILNLRTFLMTFNIRVLEENTMHL